MRKAPSNKIEMVGKKFGHLTVLELSYQAKNWVSYWICKCDCGKEKVIKGGHLRDGLTRSCGCLYKQPKTHGMSRTRVYNIWGKMMARCYDKKNNRYQSYGARGIRVNQLWWKFENFFRDMGLPPTVKHSIDRIDNDKGYFKGNCRWATVLQQARNRRPRK